MMVGRVVSRLRRLVDLSLVFHGPVQYLDGVLRIRPRLWYVICGDVSLTVFHYKVLFYSNWSGLAV
jgi:hypothetical protein